MRPGTLERMNYYRDRADAGLQIFQDAPVMCDDDEIPILPQEGPRPMELGNNNQPMSIEKAIQVLSQDGATQKIEEKIESLQSEIGKLRRMLKVVRGVSEAAPRARKKREFELTDAQAKKEQNIVEYVEEHGPASAKEIGAAIGMHYLAVGMAASRSSRLQKGAYGKIELA